MRHTKRYLHPLPTHVYFVHVILPFIVLYINISLCTCGYCKDAVYYLLRHMQTFIQKIHYVITTQKFSK